MVKDHHDILEDTLIFGNTHRTTNRIYELLHFFLEIDA